MDFFCWGSFIWAWDQNKLDLGTNLLQVWLVTLHAEGLQIKELMRNTPRDYVFHIFFMLSAHLNVWIDWERCMPWPKSCNIYQVSFPVTKNHFTWPVLCHRKKTCATFWSPHGTVPTNDCKVFSTRKVEYMSSLSPHKSSSSTCR